MAQFAVRICIIPLVLLVTAGCAEDKTEKQPKIAPDKRPTHLKGIQIPVMTGKDGKETKPPEPATVPR
jgi:hypothetical protein